MNVLQKQYDEQLKEMEAKARQNKRHRHRKGNRQTPGAIGELCGSSKASRKPRRPPRLTPRRSRAPGRSSATPLGPCRDVARRGSRRPTITLPGEESIVPEQVRKTTKIVIDADTFKVIGKHVTMKVFEYRLKFGCANPR